MNPHIISAICRSLITKEDHATAAGLQEELGKIRAQMRKFNINFHDSQVDAARAAYVANPTAENLTKLEEVVLTKHNHQKVFTGLAQVVSDAETRLMLERIAPWEISVVQRILPAAREHCTKLLTSERRRGTELIGRTIATSDVTREAENIVPYLEGLLKTLPRGMVDPRNFMREFHCHAQSDAAA